MNDKDVKRPYLKRDRKPKGTHGPMWLIGLMGLLMGCSSGEDVIGAVPVEEGTPIAFAAEQQKQGTVTRAGLEEKNVTAFTVFGYKNMSYENDEYGGLQTVFPGYQVNWTTNSAYTTTTNSDNWEYVNQGPNQTIKYWDWSAKAYRFFGVTGELNVGNGDNGTYGTYKDNGTYEITMTADGSSDESIAATPYYSHLWFSTGNTSEGYQPFGKPVQLEFLKPLSMVRFMFTFEVPEDASSTTLTDKSFCPTNGSIINTNAQITVSYPLTGTATEESYAITSEPGGITKFDQDYYEEVEKEGGDVIAPYYHAEETPLKKVYAVLPASNQGTYTLTVSVNGEPKTTVVPSEFMDWKIGYLYTYIFKVHVDGGVKLDKVQSAFTNWTDHQAEHTVYNW